MRRLALSLGLLSGSLAAALGQSTPSSLPPVAAGSPAQTVIANPFPAAKSEVTSIPLSASEEYAAERILTQPRVWAAADYMVLYSQNANTPALIQSVPSRFVSPGNTPEQVINHFPSSRDLRYRAISGFRVSAGATIQPELGIDGTVFWTETLQRTATLSGNGAPGTDGIGRPYIQAGTGNSLTLYSSLPGQYGGSVSATTSIQALGADVNIRKDGIRFFVDRNEWLVGARYFELSERVAINDRSLIGGTTFTTHDEFQSRNQFYGGQFGMHSRLYGPKWSLDFINKLALGSTHQQVRSFGSNSIIFNGVENQEAGGLYARGANAGFFERDRFAAVAESSVIAGYQLTEGIRLQIGYTGTWISSVIRAPEVIDPNVNDSNIRFIAQPAPSTANLPAFRWGRASDFFLQGMTFGVNVGF